jgi:LPS sulfotransferase NodH
MVVNDIVTEERMLVKMITRLGLPMTTVSYEGLTSDRAGTISSVLDFLGIEAPEGTSPETRLTRQSGSWSEAAGEKHHRVRTAWIHRAWYALGLVSILREPGWRFYFHRIRKKI